MDTKKQKHQYGYEPKMERMEQLISVIVPVYNVEAYLDRCIQSIQTQTYQNFELILVDDASTDSSGEICDKWAACDIRIHTIHKTFNEGLSCARNTGVKIAQGDYLCFVDSDDYILNTYLEVLLNNAIACGADVSYCHFARVYQEGWTQEDAAAPIVTIEKKQSHELWKLLSSINNYDGVELVVAWNKLIRKEVAKSCFFPPHVWHEDEFYINQLIEKTNNFVETTEILYFYQQRPESITGKSKKNNPKHMDIIDAFEERVTVAKKKGRFADYNQMVMAYRGTILMQYSKFGAGATAVRLKKRLLFSFFQYPNFEKIKNIAKYVLFILGVWKPYTS